MKKADGPYCVRWGIYDDDKALFTAVEKLLCARQYDGNKDVHALSTLSHRIGLDILLPAGLSPASDAVKGHMRFVRGLSRNRVFIQTATPSEPLLSLAAMRCLMPANGDLKPLTDTIHTLNKTLLRGGVVEKGIGGELLTRLLFTIARDRATDPLKELATEVRRFTVVKFLDTPFGEEEWYLPPQLERQQMRIGIGTGWMNFTHFLQLENILPGTIDV